jgi:hypothetical protein
LIKIAQAVCVRCFNCIIHAAACVCN